MGTGDDGVEVVAGFYGLREDGLEAVGHGGGDRGRPGGEGGRAVELAGERVGVCGRLGVDGGRDGGGDGVEVTAEFKVGGYAADVVGHVVAGAVGLDGGYVS